jgi:hypothetical protein
VRNVRLGEKMGAFDGGTHSFLDLAEFLELLAEGAIIGVPGKATSD